LISKWTPIWTPKRTSDCISDVIVGRVRKLDTLWSQINPGYNRANLFDQ